MAQRTGDSDTLFTVLYDDGVTEVKIRNSSVLDTVVSALSEKRDEDPYSPWHFDFDRDQIEVVKTDAGFRVTCTLKTSSYTDSDAVKKDLNEAIAEDLSQVFLGARFSVRIRLRRVG